MEEERIYHVPVMLKQVIDYLEPFPGKVLLDCTAGGGGHSEALLQKIIPNGKLIAMDQDKEAVQATEKRLSRYGNDKYKVIHSNFEHLKEVVTKIYPHGLDGILFDLGVSSRQLDEAKRGFSYQQDAPLDMRMNKAAHKTAADVLNGYTEEELAQIIWRYGEERWARRIAQFIVKARENQAILTTGELVEIIKKAVPKEARREGPHPAKRTFQAIRIEVNRELEIIKTAIEQAVEMLKPQGKIAVISFHSLEDRIVKQTLRELSKGCICPKDLPVCVCGKKALIKITNSKPILPSQEEIEENPRARSAKLRLAEKI